MRSIFDRKSFKKSVTSNFFWKITGTFLGFSSLSFVCSLLFGICLLELPSDLFDHTIRIFFFSMLFFAVISIFIHILITKNTLYPLKEIIKWASKSNHLEEIEIHPYSAKELRTVFEIFNSMIQRIQKNQQDLFENSESTLRMARQVSHDIRSPLAALNMLIRQDLKDLPEERRILVRQQIDRIQDIANALLIKNKIEKQEKKNL